MSTLPEKLVDRLNRIYDLGGYDFGTILQECFASIGAQPPVGSCLTVPNYASNAAAETACGQIEGNTYYNSTSGTLNFWDGTQWASIDPVQTATILAGQGVTIGTIQADILTIQTTLTGVQNDFTAHNHDGVNSQPILAKNLISTGDPAGAYYFSDGAGGVDCGPIAPALEIQLGGVTVDAATGLMNFSSDCFAVTQTAGGQVLVDMPAVLALKTTVANNSAAILTNTSGITAANASIGTLQTQVNNNEAEFDTHIHNGTDAPKVRAGDLLSVNSVGTNLSANAVLCADGSGDWTFVDKTTLGGGGGEVNTASNVGAEAEVFKQKTLADLEFRTLKAGTNITIVQNADDIEISAAGGGGGGTTNPSTLKTLATSSTGGLMPSLDFSGLTSGKRYRAEFTFRIQQSSPAGAYRGEILFYQNSPFVAVHRFDIRGGTSGDTMGTTHYIAFEFTSNSAANLIADFTNTTGNLTLFAAPGVGSSYAQLTELNNYVAGSF